MCDLNCTISTIAWKLELLQTELAETNEAANTVWLLFAGALVFFMQCGFGMLEAGAVRSRATQAIMLKNLFDVSLGGLLWWLVGFGFTNGGGNSFIGLATPSSADGSLFATAGLTAADSDDERPPASGVSWALVFFQFTFAAAASTLVSGAVAERAQLPAYLAFSSVMTAVIYPVVAHWVWSDVGWLSTHNTDSVLGGVVDFAGSGVVHMTGGVAAFAGAAIIGPRRGRFDENGHPVPMPGHSAVLQVLGTFILWTGWYGFNAGSTLGIDAGKARIAGRVVLTTTLSAAAGGAASVLLERARGRAKAWDVAAMCNGILAGLVSITAGCATVTPWAALIIGAAGGGAQRAASRLMVDRLRIDDPLDAFAVHGAGGCWGVLAAALFSTPDYALAVNNLGAGGLFYGDGQMLGAAVVFLLAHLAWVGSLSAALFFGLHKLALLRSPMHHMDLATGGGMDASHTSSVDMDGSLNGGTPFEPGPVREDQQASTASAQPTESSSPSAASAQPDRFPASTIPVAAPDAASPSAV